MARTSESQGRLDRRDFLRLVASGALLAGAGLPAASCSGSTTRKKVVVLGLDGLDPGLLRILREQGRAPNFERLERMGAFRRLATTMPALSPVAWSSFITGLTPGGHGIGDFILRDPKTYLPVFSIYETLPVRRTLELGGYEFPVSGGGLRNLRRGTPFWAHLTERGIPAVVVKIPTNFPIDETATRAISGMGTPDLADAYGLFNYYTSDSFEDFPDLSGGNVHYVEVRGGRVRAELVGPINSFVLPRDTQRDPFANNARLPFQVYVDERSDAARIDIAGHTLVLNRGEFSEWVEVEFEMVPLVGKVSGICRFLLKEVHPHLRLYVTPINIDPSQQAMPVTWPEEYGAELAAEVGPFWTKGLPCDTKAFDHHVFSDEDYVKNAELILEETLALFDYEWSRFRSGLFYFYVSNTDQDAHMLWRNMDQTHPMHHVADVRFSGYLLDLYSEMDRLVGKVLPAIDDDTLLLVCSDHGFAPFGRQFHLNTWLRERGYLKLLDEAKKKDNTTILDVDWRHTAAYGMGFNGLYLNLKGREQEGILEPGSSKVREIMGRLCAELEALRDDETGRQPIAKVYRRDDLYSGEVTPEMSELLVGYTPGFRCSADSVVGETGREILNVNPWAWSGDHSMAKDLIPGCLFSSRQLLQAEASILDLPVTILDYFGVEKPAAMVGRSLFRA